MRIEFVFGKAGAFDRVHEAKPAALERGARQQHARGSLFGVRGLRLEQLLRDDRARERADRIRAWPHQRHAPTRAACREESAVQVGDEPCSDQRRLTAPGGADNREKPRAAHCAEDLLALALPAEEQEILLLIEGTQARKRADVHDRLGRRVHGGFFRRARNGATASGAKPPAGRSTSASTVSTSSFSRVEGSAT